MFQVVESLLRSNLCQKLLEDSPTDLLDNSRTTCLHLAAKNGYIEIIKYVFTYNKWQVVNLSVWSLISCSVVCASGFWLHVCLISQMRWKPCSWMPRWVVGWQLICIRLFTLVQIDCIIDCWWLSAIKLPTCWFQVMWGVFSYHHHHGNCCDSCSLQIYSPCLISMYWRSGLIVT